eukprot:524387-Amorphochlora_amoeboformis.AAC.1
MTAVPKGYPSLAHRPPPPSLFSPLLGGLHSAPRPLKGPGLFARSSLCTFSGVIPVVFGTTAGHS